MVFHDQAGGIELISAVRVVEVIGLDVVVAAVAVAVVYYVLPVVKLRNIDKNNNQEVGISLVFTNPLHPDSFCFHPNPGPSRDAARAHGLTSDLVVDEVIAIILIRLPCARMKETSSPVNFPIFPILPILPIVSIERRLPSFI